VGLDGQIELEALGLYGVQEAAPALLCGTPTLPVGQCEFAAEVALGLPSLPAGAVEPRARGSRRPAHPAPAIEATARQLVCGGA